MRYTQRETKEDKGRQWRMRLASSENLTRSKDTATAGVSSATTSFPEMASSAPNDDGVWFSRSQILNSKTSRGKDHAEADQ